MTEDSAQTALNMIHGLKSWAEAHEGHCKEARKEASTQRQEAAVQRRELKAEVEKVGEKQESAIVRVHSRIDKMEAKVSQGFASLHTKLDAKAEQEIEYVKAQSANDHKTNTLWWIVKTLGTPVLTAIGAGVLVLIAMTYNL